MAGSLHCGKRSLEYIPKSLKCDNVGHVLSIASLGGGGLKKRDRQIVNDGHQRYKLPALTTGLVQKENKFRRVKMTCKYFVFPFLHRLRCS